MINFMLFIGTVVGLFIYFNKKAKIIIDEEIRKALRDIPLENELMFTKEVKQKESYKEFNQ